MKASFLSLGILLIGLLAFSCQTEPAPLTDAQKAAVSDSAKAVMQEVFTGMEKLSAAAYLQPYSSQPDVRFAEDGILYPSLDTVKAVAESFFQLLEFTTNKVDVFDVVVLGPEAAAVMAPFHFTAKTKAGNEAKGQGVLSAVVQRRAGRWQIVHGHESHFNIPQIMADLFPPKPKK